MRSHALQQRYYTVLYSNTVDSVELRAIIPYQPTCTCHVHGTWSDMGMDMVHIVYMSEHEIARLAM